CSGPQWTALVPTCSRYSPSITIERYASRCSCGGSDWRGGCAVRASLTLRAARTIMLVGWMRSTKGWSTGRRPSRDQRLVGEALLDDCEGEGACAVRRIESHLTGAKLLIEVAERQCRFERLGCRSGGSTSIGCLHLQPHDAGERRDQAPQVREERRDVGDRLTIMRGEQSAARVV